MLKSILSQTCKLTQLVWVIIPTSPMSWVYTLRLLINILTYIVRVYCHFWKERIICDPFHYDVICFSIESVLFVPTAMWGHLGFSLGYFRISIITAIVFLWRKWGAYSDIVGSKSSKRSQSQAIILLNFSICGQSDTTERRRNNWVHFHINPMSVNRLTSFRWQ